MPVFRIPDEHVFPHPSLAEPDGLLGVGGDLHPARLLLGYANAIFPWYNDHQPILWFSPDPRFVLDPRKLKVGRSLAKRVRQQRYQITLDTAFEQVLLACRGQPRPGQSGTWITRDMVDAYLRLHELGFAHSTEAWLDGELVGGLYGVGLGRLYSGESMFHHAPDASKVAFVWLARQLRDWGFGLIDCQVHTDNLARFGAVEISRDAYLYRIGELVRDETRLGPWSFEQGFVPDELRGRQPGPQDGGEPKVATG